MQLLCLLYKRLVVVLGTRYTGKKRIQAFNLCLDGLYPWLNL
jgi:hypothetical protein